MKNISILLLLLISYSSCSQEKKMSHTEEIEQFQYKLNVHYSDKKTSPLKPRDLRKFKSLSFFPTNESYKIEANFTRTPDAPIFEMPTSGEKTPLYAQYGIATFVLNGQEVTLRVYQNQKLILDPEYYNHLFIPFNDKTNGVETYDAGRYIDLEIPKGDTIVIDFNKAYNPYCAYNDGYSCPIPPEENNLEVEVKAGVMTFQKH